MKGLVWFGQNQTLCPQKPLISHGHGRRKYGKKTNFTETLKGMNGVIGEL